MSVPDGDEPRRSSSRRRVYDALLAAAKGTPLEAAVARYAAETGTGPEDAVWETAAPMLFAASIPKPDDALTEAVRVAVFAAIGKMAGTDVVQGLAKEAQGPVAKESIGKVVDAGVASVREVATVAKGAALEMRTAWKWWHPFVAASAAAMVVAVGALAEGKYVHDTAASAAYSQGYAAALRQHHLK